MATTIGHSIERAGFRRRRPLSTAHVLSRECFQAICQRRVALPVRHSFDGEPDGSAIYKKALPFPTKRFATSTRNAEHIASHGLLC